MKIAVWLYIRTKPFRCKLFSGIIFVRYKSKSYSFFYNLNWFLIHFQWQPIRFCEQTTLIWSSALEPLTYLFVELWIGFHPQKNAHYMILAILLYGWTETSDLIYITNNISGIKCIYLAHKTVTLTVRWWLQNTYNNFEESGELRNGIPLVEVPLKKQISHLESLLFSNETTRK